MRELYIGLMSGTSLDGVDGVVADFAAAQPRVLAHHSLPFSDALRAEFLQLNSPGDNELHRAALAANALARLYASVVHALLHTCGLPAQAIQALGAHGQTVRHRPGEFDGTGYTLQINQPAYLAELTGITVVADLRSRDVAAGGQGAPLVPPFHHAFFASHGTPMAVLNLGGIANLSILNHPVDTIEVLGFDCGPGNALMDAWCNTHTGAPYDAAGKWAASGTVLPKLLNALMDAPFLRQSPPKSTGRDMFNTGWLHNRLQAAGCDPQRDAVRAVDVQCTLTEFTATACAQALLRIQPDCRHVVVCGGGAYNSHLLRRLQAHLSLCKVESSDALGLPPLQVEACAFAWLARQTMLGRSGNLPAVTGARAARILGGIYLA